MTDRELMQQALEALDDVLPWSAEHSEIRAALRERLAQQEQEPHIGWLVRDSQSGKLDLLTDLQIDSSLGKYERLHKLYTRPQAREQPPQRVWQGLTEDEIVQIGVATGLNRVAVGMIETKLKEKNA